MTANDSDAPPPPILTVEELEAQRQLLKYANFIHMHPPTRLLPEKEQPPSALGTSCHQK